MRIKHLCFYLTVLLTLIVSCSTFSVWAAASAHLSGASFSLPEEARAALNETQPPLKKANVQKAVSSSLWRMIPGGFFVLFAVLGAVPVLAFFVEYNLAGLHAFINHFSRCKNLTPHIAVVIPAWNEALVLEHTINLLLQMDYPKDALRLYVVDDGSTDDTAEVVARMQERFPQNILYLPKRSGGKGKAYAINFGLKAILSNEWADAILLIDADISFKKDALLRMARHLADSEVGAVTAYIKVGNRSTNYITRSIGYEYIVSQSIARRAQNVMGAQACLAGGAQLHRRSTIEALGGEIDTTTLAEDTYTTLAIQKMGKKVIYEGNAFVYAEEPKTIVDVWKQRFRWGRGNWQITRAFRSVWFRRSLRNHLGGTLFGIIWFCVLLSPFIMILSAIGLVGLYVINPDYSTQIFFYLMSVSLFVYMYTTLFAILIDNRTSKLSWLEGIMYPGIISLLILIFSVNPDFFMHQIDLLLPVGSSAQYHAYLLLFMFTWSGFCMLFAWLIYRLELAGLPTRITNALIFIVGYGPLLCAVNLSAYMAEIRKTSPRWDKTEKITSLRVIRPREDKPVVYDFEQTLNRDKQREYRFVCRQMASIIIVSIIFWFIYS